MANLGDKQLHPAYSLVRRQVMIPVSFVTDGSGDVSSSTLPTGVSLSKTGTGEYTLSYPAASTANGIFAIFKSSTGIEVDEDVSTAGSVVITTDSPAANLVSATVSGIIIASATSAT